MASHSEPLIGEVAWNGLIQQMGSAAVELSDEQPLIGASSRSIARCER